MRTKRDVHGGGGEARLADEQAPLAALVRSPEPRRGDSLPSDPASILRGLAGRGRRQRPRNGKIAPGPFPDRAPGLALALLVALGVLAKERLALLLTGLEAERLHPAATAGVGLLLAAAVLALPRRLAPAAAVLLALGTSTLIWADVLYYRQFHDLTSVEHLRFLHQVTMLDASLVDLARPADLLLGLDLPLHAALTLRRRRRDEGRGARQAIVWGLAGAMLVAAVVALDPTLSLPHGDRALTARSVGLIAYHGVAAGFALGRALDRWRPEASAAAELERWLEERRSASTPGPLAGTLAGGNVLVLQVESLQAFVIGLTVEGELVAPHLTRLAGESLHFTRFFHQTGQGTSSDADLLAQCSLYPARVGAAYFRYDHDDFRCLPDLLAAAGYATVGMQGIRKGFWNLDQVYPAIGIQRYDSIESFAYAPGDLYRLGLRDPVFLEQAAGKIELLPEPFYAFLATLSSHDPFNGQGLPAALALGPLAGSEAGHYLDAVHYADAAIGAFLARLGTSGLLDRTLLVLYGDHNGVFREASGLGALLGLAPDDHAGWFLAENQVPLLVRLPDGEAAGRRDRLAGQVDVAPTIAALLGLPPGAAPFLGRDLLAATDDDLVVCNNGSALDDTRLFLFADRQFRSRCLEVGGGRDLPLDACADLAGRAHDRLRRSRLILDHDLAPRLSRPGP